MECGKGSKLGKDAGPTFVFESAEILIICGQTFPGDARLEAWQNTPDAYAPRREIIEGVRPFPLTFWAWTP